MVSKQARKQRKRQYNAPDHVRRKMVSSHLSDDLKKQFKRRSAMVVKGDTVMVLRGDEKVRNVEGKVTAINTRTGKVVVEGVTIAKADGTLKERPVHASNLVITKLNLTDPWRKEKLEGVKEGSA
ncbi:MAG TPA: 50S ribosomal protein L24 [Methanomassiliicoccales archaeon]|nr:50S ribosomal protein L24 [Methanomassiliicoccales archaeon]